MYREMVRERLLAMQELKYQEFQKKLIPNCDKILGVRSPELRKLAKEICKGDWRTFLAENDREYYENDLLQGFVTAQAKMDYEERLERIRAFVPRINNWAVCDGFCTSLKDTKKHKEEMWDFLQDYLKSEEPYEIRFGVVMLLCYYVETEYLTQAFAAFDAISHEEYYVRMAVAWAVSIYYIHYPEETDKYLRNNKLDDWTSNKALQKIVESYRIDEETKQRIRSMKRK